MSNQRICKRKANSSFPQVNIFPPKEEGVTLIDSPKEAGDLTTLNHTGFQVGVTHVGLEESPYIASFSSSILFQETTYICCSAVILPNELFRLECKLAKNGFNRNIIIFYMINHLINRRHWSTCISDSSLFLMFCKNWRSTQDTEKESTSYNQFKKFIEEEIEIKEKTRFS